MNVSECPSHLEKRWKRTKLESDRVMYRSACKSANILINESRRLYYSSLIDKTEPGSKKRWDAAKDILHSSDPTETLDEPACVKRCLSFADFFRSKINLIKTAIANKLSAIGSINPFDFDRPHTGAPLELDEETDNEVLKILHSMSDKSSPMDLFPSSLLKLCADVFAPVIAKLANLSFSTGVFPAVFRTASVLPLLKKEGLDPDEPSNYRPVSRLNTISKVLEKLFLARLLPHVTLSPNYNGFQSAYRGFHSTETALLKIVNDVYCAVGNHSQTLLVALDLSAAFDTIDKSTLLTRLEGVFGIRGVSLERISSYLADRMQFVSIGNARSPPQDCTFGVPQGSVLGPVLFTLFLSPLAVISSFGVDHHQYADDTQLYVSLSLKNAVAQINRLTECTTAVYRWFLANGLALNPSKSKSLLTGTVAGTGSLSEFGSVNIADAQVCISDTVKSLGVILDTNLTFRPHVDAVCKSCFFHIRALRHVKTVCLQTFSR